MPLAAPPGPLWTADAKEPQVRNQTEAAYARPDLFERRPPPDGRLREDPSLCRAKLVERGSPPAGQRGNAQGMRRADPMCVHWGWRGDARPLRTPCSRSRPPRVSGLVRLVAGYQHHAAVVAQRERCCPGLPAGTVRSTRRLCQAVPIAWWYFDGQAAMLDAVRATRMASANGNLLVAAGEPQSVGRTRLEGVRWHKIWHSCASRRSGISSLTELLSAPPRPSPACSSPFRIEQLTFRFRFTTRTSMPRRGLSFSNSLSWPIPTEKSQVGSDTR